MIDILSLPRGNKLATGQLANGKQSSLKTGLPINSLPGWELIPLNCKLPMLKCPTNQVIFSKDKIGNSLKCTMQEFDSSSAGRIPEYNPLHDSNLKRFYSNDRNLKRLRQNGEITDDNDVICNLKDFNQYREDLHKSKLYYVLQAYREREAERQDRLLIANAEGISRRDDLNPSSRHHTLEAVLARKQRLEEEQHRRKLQLVAITEQKFQRIEQKVEMEQVMLEQRKQHTRMRIDEHLALHQDLQRKKLIKKKKLFQFKNDRYHRNVRKLEKQRLQQTEGQLQSWDNRLQQRIANQQRIQILLQEVDAEREDFIESHKSNCQEMWQEIQDQIRERAGHKPKTKHCHKQKPKLQQKKPLQRASTIGHQSICDEFQSNFEGLLDSELCYALNTAMAMDGHALLTFSPYDPIYKAAQYITKHILRDFDIDLSDDDCARSVLVNRIMNFMCDAKKYVNYKSIQIIRFARDNKSIPSLTAKPASMQKTNSRVSHVSFCGAASTIGISSYEIHPFVDVRPCGVRRPTPAGSLTSLVVSQIADQSVQQKVHLPHLKRNEVVFIEHYLVKFKREFLVGMDKQVFAAIKCHFENHFMEIREELLELNDDFLYNQIALGILSYAVNPLNFDAALRLAVSVLSSEIICELQQTLLKPGNDPRGMSHPTSCGSTREKEIPNFC